MKKINIKRERFEPDKIPVLGSLGLLALGDIGFEAWRKIKAKKNNSDLNEK